MRRQFLRRSAEGLALVVAAVALPSAGRAELAKGHRIALHVGSDDPALMHGALNNIANAHKAYADLGHTVSIELVANGGGYSMLRADTSPVRDRLAEIHQLFPAVVFSACQSSRRRIAAAEHKALQDIVQVPEATDVPAGIVRLTELQEQGWSYIRV